jgi:xanthine dehydrogenase YagS FAD-binding subunit
MQRFEWSNARSPADAAGATTVAAAMTTPRAPTSADEVLVKAGGIDLLDLLKEGLLQPRRLINLRTLGGLDRIIEQEDGAVRLGALATLAQIAEHPLVRRRYRALADAAGVVASPQIRHAATLGGNLLQRPRCWYFRSADYHCTRKGGAACFAFGGDNQYHAIFDHQHCAIVHPSTVATALVALGASVALRRADGTTRELALEDFFILPAKDAHRENDLQPGEILSAIVLPKLSPGARSVHLKQGEKDSFDWPIADVAVLIDRDASGICRQASIVLGAAAPVPHRAKAAEALLLGKPIDDATAREAAHASLAGAVPLTKNAYKLPIFETLVRRAILASSADP